MIEVSGLTKIYRDSKRGEVRAVDGVSFLCNGGKVYGLLGPNGAGKTTCLRMLSTVIAPTFGSARVAGYDIATEPEKVRAHIGFLSGDTGLYPRLTPGELFRYFGRLYGLQDSEISERMEELFALFGVKEFQNVKIDRLSSGMKQKVNIVRTLIHNPSILILDEPTKGLDVLTSRTIIQFIRSSAKEGKCVLFSTHILSEAERICDEILILHKGKIYFSGRLEEFRAMSREANLEESFLLLVGEKLDAF